MHNKTNIISHGPDHTDLDEVVAQIKARISSKGDLAHVGVQEQLKLVDDLTQFELGRFLLQNRGMNGYWAHQIATYRPGSRIFSHPLEKFWFEVRPTAKATQERLNLFLKLNQTCVKNDAVLLSVPVGVGAELLSLDFSDIQRIELIGMDLDPEAIEQSNAFAHEKKVSKFYKAIEKNAWHLDYEEIFDLISSSGLTMYEKRPERILDLYCKFYKAIKPGGMLVTSYLTKPPLFDGDETEWDMSQIIPQDLRLQRIVIENVLEVKWQSYRTQEETFSLLREAGFEEIEIFYDRAKLFPTVKAMKR